MKAAMFRTTGQALHFAYRMQVTEAPLSCPLGNEMHRSPDSKAFDADSLSPSELRALCAQIRKRVEGLGGLRSTCLIARYAIQVHKAEAINSLVRDAAPLVGFESETALRALVWGMFLPTKSRDGLSYRKIEAETSVNRNSLHRASVALRDRWHPFEAMGYDMLTDSLVADQLVEGA